MSGARWALRPLASASFSLRSGTTRTPFRASSACAGRANAACAHTPAVASAARHAIPPSRRVCSSSSVPAMTRHLARARGACFLLRRRRARRAERRGVARGHRGHHAPPRAPRDPRQLPVRPPPRGRPVLDGAGAGCGRRLDRGDTLEKRGFGSKKASRRRTNEPEPLSPPSPSTYAVPMGSRIFCNRSLNMSSIAAVGFDMDYTLAMYKPETFEKLAYARDEEEARRRVRLPLGSFGARVRPRVHGPRLGRGQNARQRAKDG